MMNKKPKQILIEHLIVGPFQSNCWILACKKTNEAVIIDPGEEAERILKRVENHNLDLRYIIHTHGHLDHVAATATIQKKTNAELLMHEADKMLIENLAVQAASFGISAPQIPVIDRYIREGDKISFGEQVLSVIETPGHSPGGICLKLDGDEKIIFVGDTIFAESIGRTDLWEASYQQLIKSIREKLLILEDDFAIYPGHGPTTTINKEKRYNPFLQEI